MSVGEARHRDRPRRASAAEHREGIRFLVDGDGMAQGAELRELPDGAGSTLYGHFTPFDRWAEIDSFFEGNFMERTVKGAFKRTIAEQRDSMKVLFQHGRDPQIDKKPIGTIDVLREEAAGPYYEVSLLDAPYVRDTLLPGLRAKVYGASYKFRVMREEINEDPGISAHNPKGIPERTIKEAQVYEFGPVTFPAFPEASAGVRSGTDDYFLAGLAAADPEIVRMAADGADFSALIAHRLGVLPEDELEGAGNEERENEDVVEDHEDREGHDGFVAVQALIDGGFTAESVVRAVEAEDMALLEIGNAVDSVEEEREEEREEEAEDKGQEAQAAPPQVRKQEAESDKPAAPGISTPTPLLGVKKEPWRL